ERAGHRPWPDHRRRPLHPAASVLPGQLRQGPGADDRRRHLWRRTASWRFQTAGGLRMTITSFGPANRIARSAETHPLTWRLRDDGEPVWLAEYESKNGYAAARKALAQMSADDIVQSVKDSGLKGRGGAGFPTGVKWGLMPKDESMNIRYLLCNADEMEPNTYKDRLLMEQLPHLLIEGMLIAARALKAYRGYIFLRGEYIDCARILNRAVAEAKDAGLLGRNIFGSGFDFELFVHTGAGHYICGEETALINSLEGRRANPRAK